MRVSSPLNARTPLIAIRAILIPTRPDSGDGRRRGEVLCDSRSHFADRREASPLRSPQRRYSDRILKRGLECRCIRNERWIEDYDISGQPDSEPPAIGETALATPAATSSS